MDIFFFIRWSNGSSKQLPRKSPVYRKTYFYAKGPDGKALKDFRKDVYFPINNPDHIAVLHYIGNDKISMPGNHGNSLKQTKLFFRTKPSVMKRMAEEVQSEVPHKIYKKMITEESESPINEATDRPRNVKQLSNIKASQLAQQRISRDAIMNLHEMAFEENGFIWHITTYPDLVVICGQQEILTVLSETIAWNRAGVLLSYDTTFCLGEFYVSTLLFRCSVFEENPTVPSLFLFHERKHQSVHELLFSIFTKLIKRTAGLPIVVDMEQGIVNAIKTKTGLAVAGCWRHLREDVQRKMISVGIPLQVRNEIVDNVYSLLRSKSADAYSKQLEDFTKQWPEVITDYFMQNINGRIEHYVHWSIHPKFNKYITEHGITTNQSEGFNWLLHDLQEWKEAPVDCVVLSFRLLQSYYLSEIKRGKSGLGTYTLHHEFNELAEEISTHSPNRCHPKDIVTSIKEKKIMFQESESETLKNQYGDNSKILRAQEIIQKDCISLSSKLGIFTVSDERNFYFVKLFPSSCSCPLKHGCIHLLAVQMALNMPIDQAGMKNLTTVRKNARETKRAKPGRKKPRVGDVEQQNEEDVEVGKKETDEIDTPPVDLIKDNADQSFERDVEYSKEVWIAADGKILKENLNMNDKGLITNPFGWLNGTLVDAAMNIINHQFPKINGLQSCCLAINLNFIRHKATDPFIQIINRTTKNSGSHWLTVTNIGCEEGAINICDSSFSNIPSSEAEVLCSLVDIKGVSLQANMLDVFQQDNSYDCGVYAIANMVAIAYRRDPTKQRFDKRNMRNHLLNCLERRHFEPFPTSGSRNVKRTESVKDVHEIPVYCTCKMPDTHTLYVICDGCEKEFHPSCIGFGDEEAKKMKIIFCPACRSN